MPTRTYTSPHDPPWPTDRIIYHAWAFWVGGLCWATLGTLLALEWARTGHAYGALSNIALAGAAYIVVALMASGLAVVVAVLWPGSDSTAWTLRVVALLIGSGAWGAFALAPGTSVWWQVLAAAFVGAALSEVYAAVVSRERHHRIERRARARARLQG